MNNSMNKEIVVEKKGTQILVFNYKVHRSSNVLLVRVVFQPNVFFPVLFPLHFQVFIILTMENILRVTS